jgi:16S rRNA (guanine527-N7)-methyltransferase
MVSRETLITRYFPGHESEITAYADFLTSAGIERGLIGPKEGEIIWERHIFNCLPVISLIPHGVKVIDIGSGAGLPGIPIALARPDLTVLLVEPLQRRVDFLNEALELIAIESATVFRGRAQHCKTKAEIVTARAVAPIEKLKTITWHLLKPGGSLLAIKGMSAQEEATRVQGAQYHEIDMEDLPQGRIISLRKPG